MQKSFLEGKKIFTLVACCMIFTISAYGEVDREERRHFVNKLLDVQIDDSKARNVNRIYTGRAAGAITKTEAGKTTSINPIDGRINGIYKRNDAKPDTNYNINGVNITFNDVTMYNKGEQQDLGATVGVTRKATESLVYGVFMGSLKGENKVNDVTLTLNNTKIYDKDDQSYQNFTGALVGKYDEVNTISTKLSEGLVEAKNINVVLNESNVNNLKGVEANSKNGYVDISGSVTLNNSEATGYVQGAYAGSVQLFEAGTNINATPNSTASSLTANGSVFLDSSLVEKNVYGALALGKNEANTKGNVEIKNNSTVGGDIYSAFANSTTNNSQANADLTISENSTVNGNIYSAKAEAKSGEAKAIGNLDIKNSTVGGDIYGAFVNSINGNSQAQAEVNIKDSEVKGNIYSAFAKTENGDATSSGILNLEFADNERGELKGDLYASYAESKNGNAISEKGEFSVKNADIIGIGDLIGSYANSAGENSSLGGLVKLENSNSERNIYGAKAESKKDKAEAQGIADLLNSSMKGEKLYGAYANANLKKSEGGSAQADGKVLLENSDISSIKEFQIAYVNAKKDANATGEMNANGAEFNTKQKFVEALSSEGKAQAQGNIKLSNSEKNSTAAFVYSQGKEAQAEGDINLENSTLKGNQKFIEASSSAGDANASGTIILKDSKLELDGKNINSYGFSSVSNKGNSEVSGNIALENTNIDGRFYSAHSAINSSDATSLLKNVSVILNKSTIGESLYGGYLEHRGGTGKAQNIFLSLKDSTVNDQIMGFLNSSSKAEYINSIDVDGIAINLENSKANSLYGVRTLTYGGDSKIQNVSIYLNNSQIEDFLYGARASTSSGNSFVTSNIILNNSDIGGNLYGSTADYYKEFPAENQDAQADATMQVLAGSKANNITGAKAVSAKGDANAKAKVVIDNSEIKGDIIAAYAESQDKKASANGSLYLQDNTKLADGKNVYASFIEDSNAIEAEGSILVDKVKANDNSIYGVHAQSNEKDGDVALKANIRIFDSELNNSKITGVYFDSNSDKENINLTSNINIENSKAGDILGSHLTLDKDTKSVHTENNIFIGEGSDIQGKVIGGYVDMKDLNDDIDFRSKNTITVDGKVNFDEKSEIFGQLYNKDDNPNIKLNYDAMDENTLKYSANPIKIAKLGNFDTYEFTINDLNKDLIHNGVKEDAQGIITVTDLFKNDIDPRTGKAAEVHITGIDGKLVKPDDRIILIDLRGAEILGDGDKFDVTDLFANVDKAEADKIKIGFIRKAYVNYSLEKTINDDCSGDECSLEDSYNYTVVAKIKNKEEENGGSGGGGNGNGGGSTKPPTEPEEEFEVDEEELARLSSIYQARLASITTLNQASNLIINSALHSLEPTKFGDIIPFAAIEGGKSKYKDDGKLTNKHLNLIAGAGYSFDESVFGWFFEYGRNKYEAKNSFFDGTIRGDGKAYYQGVGLLGKSYFGNTYLDGSLRYGRAKTSYHTNDVVSSSGVSANFTKRQSYMGAHLGLGYKVENVANTFDTSIKGIYTTLGKQNKTIDDEKFKFDRINSTRLRLAEDYTYNVNKNVGLKAGLAYEYEFSAKAKGSVDGIKTKNQSLKGSTYLASLGLALHPFNSGDKNKVIEIGGKGYLGKQKGGSGNIQFTYNF